MEVISVILMFVFGNMNDQKTQMTQYIPMENLSSCLKEKRILARDKEFKKDAFCGEAIVEIEEGKVIKLYNEIPEGAVLVNKKITKEAFKEWSLKAKKRWEKFKFEDISGNNFTSYPKLSATYGIASLNGNPSQRNIDRNFSKKIVL